MTNDRSHRPRDTRRAGYWALIAAATFVAAVTFTLSFRDLDDYGRHVAHVGPLSPLVPLGIDGLTLVAVAATFVLRDAPGRVRLYAWAVFGLSVALSIGGNLSHAASRHLTWDGMVGAAVWPILLAFASHLVIVARRHLDTTQRDTTRAATAPPTPVTRPSASPVSRDVPAAPVAPALPAAPRPVTPRPTNATGPGWQVRAATLWHAGMTPQALHTRLGGDDTVSLRSVQRWVSARRDTDTDDTERVLAEVAA